MNRAPSPPVSHPHLDLWVLGSRGEADRTLEVMRQQLTELYRDIFQHLRDEAGNNYSPEEYALQQAADGAIFLVPRGTKVEAAD